MALPYSFGSATSPNKLFMAQLQADLLYLSGSPPCQVQGRLSLTDGVAVTESDVSGATVIYWVPSGGRFVPVFDGTQFVNLDVGGQLSNDSTQSSTGKAGPAAVAASKCYFDLIWSDSGTPTHTRSPPWTNDTTVGTGAGSAEIELLQGIWVNKYDITNGPAAQRGTVVGGFRSNGSSQLEDSLAKRWVSNIYNPERRALRVTESTNNWNYSTAAWRQANNSTANQLDWFHALGGRDISADILAGYSDSGAPGTSYGLVGIGIDTVAGPTSGWTNYLLQPAATNLTVPSQAAYRGFAGQGRHYASWLEYSQSAGTMSWVGDNGAPTLIQSGIYGDVYN